MSQNSLEFLQVLTERCSKFFYDMHLLCNAYNLQFGGKQQLNSTINSQGKQLQANGENTKKKQKQQQIKHPDMPKRPSSAYIIFFSERQGKVKEKFQQLNVTEISKIISKEWKALTPEKQRPYLELAAERYEEYAKKTKEFSIKHPELNIKVPGENVKAQKRKEKRLQLLQQQNQDKKQALLSSQEEDNDEDEDDSEQNQKQVVKNEQSEEQDVEEEEEEEEEESESKPQKKKKKQKSKKHKKKSKKHQSEDEEEEDEDSDSFEEKPVKRHRH